MTSEVYRSDKLTSEEYPSFSKVPRWNREILVTEKIDGTNGMIYINPITNEIKAGSRNRWLSLGNDNYGFALWVEKNKDFLIETLGHGHHYGEWWGQGIQRNYGLNHKRFSLFNVHRWKDINGYDKANSIDLYCVPTLWEGHLKEFTQGYILRDLVYHGSYACPYMNPEGIVILHKASGNLYKVTLEHDEKGKPD